MKIRISSKGDFSKTYKYMDSLQKKSYLETLDRFGRDGVRALASATPKDSGETANSWTYEIIRGKTSVKIVWKNSHVVDGVPIAVLIQYGHGTKNGGFVQGKDFINPAIRPIMEKLANDAWKEVTRL